MSQNENKPRPKKKTFFKGSKFLEGILQAHSSKISSKSIKWFQRRLLKILLYMPYRENMPCHENHVSQRI